MHCGSQLRAARGAPVGDCRGCSVACGEPGNGRHRLTALCVSSWHLRNSRDEHGWGLHLKSCASVSGSSWEAAASGCCCRLQVPTVLATAFLPLLKQAPRTSATATAATPQTAVVSAAQEQTEAVAASELVAAQPPAHKAEEAVAAADGNPTAEAAPMADADPATPATQNQEGACEEQPTQPDIAATVPATHVQPGTAAPGSVAWQEAAQASPLATGVPGPAAAPADAENAAALAFVVDAEEDDVHVPPQDAPPVQTLGHDDNDECALSLRLRTI